MKHVRMFEELLFEPPTNRVHVHLTWSPREGWQCYVSHRHEGQADGEACPPAHYDRLTFSEAVDATTIEVWELLPFLAGVDQWQRGV